MADIAIGSKINLYGAADTEPSTNAAPAPAAAGPVEPQKIPAALAVEAGRVERSADRFSTGQKLGIAAGFAAYGFAGGIASVKVFGADGGSQTASFANFKDNITHWENDWSGTKTGTKHNYLVHGPSVGIPMYWAARKMGFSPLGAAGLTTLGAGFTEAGQAIYSGHRPDAGDVLRSVAEGALGGEALIQLGNYADGKSGAGWRAVSHLGNHVSPGLVGGKPGLNYHLSW